MCGRLGTLFCGATAYCSRFLDYRRDSGAESMANEEHFKILRQNVVVWNAWRKKNPAVIPDLAEIALGYSDLCEADLRWADLRGAKLHRVKLHKADLAWVNLTNAFLTKVDLRLTSLHQADLRGADLLGAKLQGADLDQADLRGADLRGAKLTQAFLGQANLGGANLGGADLSKADLDEADLHGANLDGAKLQEANLSRANLTNANLHGADLSMVKLVRTNLSHATFTGVNLYGTAKDDWIVDDICCDYVYWDEAGNERTPPDRDFHLGEFEKLYKHLPTFTYYFEQGFTPLDPLIMEQVVQAINERHPRIELRLKNFEATGTPHATLTVLHQGSIEEAKQQLTHGYERRIAALEGKREQLIEVIMMLTNQPQYAINIKEFIMGNQIKKIAGRDFIDHTDSSVRPKCSTEE